MAVKVDRLIKQTFSMTACGILLAGCAGNMQTASMTPQAAGQTDNQTGSVTSSANNKTVTLSNLVMNQASSQVTVKPASTVKATVHYSYRCENCYKTLNNQIIVGLANRSAQACIYNGGTEGEGTAEFELKVPAKAGKYDVRFRGLQAVDCAAALKAGWREDDSPAKTTTIGVITASNKSEQVKVDQPQS